MVGTLGKASGSEDLEPQGQSGSHGRQGKPLRGIGQVLVTSQVGGCPLATQQGVRALRFSLHLKHGAGKRGLPQPGLPECRIDVLADEGLGGRARDPRQRLNAQLVDARDRGHHPAGHRDPAGGGGQIGQALAITHVTRDPAALHQQQAPIARAAWRMQAQGREHLEAGASVVRAVVKPDGALGKPGASELSGALHRQGLSGATVTRPVGRLPGGQLLARLEQGLRLLFLIGAPQLPLAQRRSGQHRDHASHTRDDSRGTWGHLAVLTSVLCP